MNVSCIGFSLQPQPFLSDGSQDILAFLFCFVLPCFAPEGPGKGRGGVSDWGGISLHAMFLKMPELTSKEECLTRSALMEMKILWV